MKVVPNPDSRIPFKYIENIFTFEEEHFGLQSIRLKRLFERYKCKICVIDGNGVGAGLIDFLVTDQEDPDTGRTLYNWGVANTYEDDYERYRKFETPDTIRDAMYIVKMNRTSNSELYAYVQSQFMNGKIRFLIPYQQAEANLLALEKGKAMSKSQREDYLVPFRQTDFLKNQMMNLVQKDDLGIIVLKQANSRVKKDKFSAFVYALYWCKMEEDKFTNKKNNLGDFVFFSAPSGQKDFWKSD